MKTESIEQLKNKLIAQVKMNNALFEQLKSKQVKINFLEMENNKLKADLKRARELYHENN